MQKGVWLWPSLKCMLKEEAVESVRHCINRRCLRASIFEQWMAINQRSVKRWAMKKLMVPKCGCMRGNLKVFRSEYFWDYLSSFHTSFGIVRYVFALLSLLCSTFVMLPLRGFKNDYLQRFVADIFWDAKAKMVFLKQERRFYRLQKYRWSITSRAGGARWEWCKTLLIFPTYFVQLHSTIRYSTRPRKGICWHGYNRYASVL